MSPLIKNLLWTGTAAALLSMSTAAARSRIENRRADTALNAQSHIVWGGYPPADAGPHRRNTVVGATLHAGAGFFWAAVFETLFGRWARRSDLHAAAGGAATALGAYVIDYKLVPQRIRPGFEFHLSRHSLHCIYAALAGGLALGAMCTRRRESAPEIATDKDDPNRVPAAGSAGDRGAYSQVSTAAIDR